MRIVGGSLRGRSLRPPGHAGVRPTSDKVRESIFNILGHGIADFELEGAKVLDLFAGTGALGLEALSRGAAYCLFVETDARSRALIQHHVAEFGLGGITRIFRRDATDLGPAGPRDRYDLVFLDPPYGRGLGERALDIAAKDGWLAENAIIVMEEAKDALVDLPDAFEVIDRRVYGSTQVVIARFTTT